MKKYRNVFSRVQYAKKIGITRQVLYRRASKIGMDFKDKNLNQDDHRLDVLKHPFPKHSHIDWHDDFKKYEIEALINKVNEFEEYVDANIKVIKQSCIKAVEELELLEEILESNTRIETKKIGIGTSEWELKRLRPVITKMKTLGTGFDKYQHQIAKDIWRLNENKDKIDDMNNTEEEHG